jgi:hypothetical protein
MRTQILKLTLSTLFFYAVARLAYEDIYRLTISVVKALATIPVNFFGKFPFWLFGDPTFGLIVASIPVLVFIINKISADKNRLLRTYICFFVFFLSTYFFNCLLTSIQLVASNDHYRDGELFYPLRQVDLNDIFIKTICISSLLTIIYFYLAKLFRLNKKGQLSNAPAANSAQPASPDRGSTL